MSKKERERDIELLRIEFDVGRNEFWIYDFLGRSYRECHSLQCFFVSTIMRKMNVGMERRIQVNSIAQSERLTGTEMILHPLSLS